MNNWRPANWSRPQFPPLKVGCVLPMPLPPHEDSVRQDVKPLGKPCPLLLPFAAGDVRTGLRACQVPGAVPGKPIVQTWPKGSEIPGSDTMSFLTWMTGSPTTMEAEGWYSGAKLERKGKGEIYVITCTPTSQICLLVLNQPTERTKLFVKSGEGRFSQCDHTGQ